MSCLVLVGFIRIVGKLSAPRCQSIPEATIALYVQHVIETSYEKSPPWLQEYADSPLGQGPIHRKSCTLATMLGAKTIHVLL